jgi:hypothetical protein
MNFIFADLFIRKKLANLPVCLEDVSSTVKPELLDSRKNMPNIHHT